MQVLMKACIGDIIKVKVHRTLHWRRATKTIVSVGGKGEHFARTETLMSPHCFSRCPTKTIVRVGGNGE